MFQFDLTINDNDYLKFNLNAAFYTDRGKNTDRFHKFYIPCLVFFCMFIYWVGEPSISLLITCVIYGLFLSSLWIIFYKKIISWYYKKVIQAKKKNGLLYDENSTLIFDEHFICDKTALQECRLSYDTVENIYITNDALYIYIGVMSAYILPYRFIENQAVFDNLVNFLQAKTNKTVINITK